MKRILLALLPTALLLLNGCHSNQLEETPPTTAAPVSNLSPVSAQTSIETADVEKMNVGREVDNNRTGTVQYHNRITGTNAEYDLDVDYDGSGDVDRITFPSGGYISDHHITDQTHNGDGTITVTTDKGQEFTVDEEEGFESEEQ